MPLFVALGCRLDRVSCSFGPRRNHRLPQTGHHSGRSTPRTVHALCGGPWTPITGFRHWNSHRCLQPSVRWSIIDGSALLEVIERA